MGLLGGFLGADDGTSPDDIQQEDDGFLDLYAPSDTSNTVNQNDLLERHRHQQASHNAAIMEPVISRQNRQAIADYFRTGEFIGDTGKTAFNMFNSRLMGVPEVGAELVGGLGGAAKATFQGESPLTGFNRGRKDQGAMFDKWRDDLGWASLPTEMVGGGTRGPQAFQDAISGKLPGSVEVGEELASKFFKPGKNTRLFPGITRTLKLGAATGSEAVLADAINNPEEYYNNPFTSMAFSFGGGMAFGSFMQGIQGELAPLVAKWGSPDWEKSDIMTELLDTGVREGTASTTPSAQALTPRALTAHVNSPEMLDNNGRLLGQDIPGSIDQQELMDRFVHHMMAIEFHDQAAHKGISRGYEERGRDLVRAAEDAVTIYNDVGNDIRSQWINLVGDPKSPRATYEDTQKALKPLQEQYKALRSTNAVGPNGGPAGGARPVSYDRTVNGIETALKNELALKDITDLDGDMAEVWNEAKTLIRGRVQDPVGKGIHAPRVGEEITPETPIQTVKLKVLMDAVDQLNKRRDPRLYAGSQYDPGKAKAATIVIKHLNEEIAKRTFGKSDTLRKDYAKYLNERDQYEFGGKAFHSNIVDDKSGLDAVDHFKGLTDGEKKAFSEGYVYEMTRSFGNRGFHNTMHSLVGEPGPIPEVFSKVSINGDKVALLENAIGKPQAKDLIDLYQNGRHREQAAQRLIDALKKKRFNPAAMNSVVHEGDGILLADALRPGQQSIFSNAILGAAKRLYSVRTPVQGDMLMDLYFAKGQDLATMTEDYLRAYNRPTSRMSPRGVGAGMSDKEEEKQTILDYLPDF